MDLEKKVQILEQEIEILKNQIQATLLDIKEQMLTHTYPVLRADVQPSTASQSANGQPMQTAASEVSEAQAASDKPQIRKVTLSDIGKSPAPQYQPEVGTAQNSATPALDWYMLQELEAWVNSTLLEIGTQHTRELINLYTKNGQFTLEMRDALLQMISVQPNNTPASRPSMPPVLSSKSHTPEQKKRPANKPQKAQPSQKEPVKQLSPAPKRDNSKRTAASQPNNPSKTVDETEGAEKNNVVLRLIAGIQNAGVGVKWKRKNG